MDAFDTLPSAQSYISVADAYRAMLEVLQYYFKVNPEHAVASMLGDLASGTWENGMPGDPAAWSLWLKAVNGKLVQEH